MRYKFKINEDGKPTIEKEGMSFKKILKSLINQDPKWSGTIRYLNKKERDVTHTIKKGKEYERRS